MKQSPFAPRVPFGQRASHAPQRRRRRAMERGQTLIIFALSVTVLLGLAGLAVDVMRAYDLYARELRAAEAGALAADLYMPTFYSTLDPTNNTTAIQRALQEVQRNGFGATATANAACDGYNTSSEVMVCTDTTVDETALQVTITEPISVFLLSVVGVQSFSVSANAGADYLYPYVLGADPNAGNSNVWGDGGSLNPKNFLASINGPAEFKQMGDPFVYCQDGPNTGPPADGNANNASTPLTDSVIGSVAGFPTNHLPFTSGGPKCGTAQGDQQPPGFTGEATKTSTTHPGAYNFAVSVTNPVGATVWIYNPPFSPYTASASCNGLQAIDQYLQDDSCNSYYQDYGKWQDQTPFQFDGTHFDDPRFAFDMTYSLYSVPAIFSRATDTLVQSQTYHPEDRMPADLSQHGCGTAYDLTQVSTYTHANPKYGTPIQPGGCVTYPTSQSWQALGTSVDPATGVVSGTPTVLGNGCSSPPPSGQTCLFRLAVEATTFSPNSNNEACAPFYCGWGRHSYAVAVCAAGATPSGSTCTSGGVISAWNNMDIYMNFPAATGNVYIPVAYIPSSYAGRTITVSLFSPGDSHGHGDNAYFILVPPDSCIPVTYPSTSKTWVRQATYPGTIYPAPPTVTGTCPQNTNGVLATKQNAGGNKPSDNIYNGLWVPMTFTLPTTFTGGQFWLDEYIQGKDFEEMGVQAAIEGGSPLHLIF